MHKKGFTLAEVLITLSIIGVVGALTIPGLARNYEEATLKNSFKKLYSELAQVTLMIKAENGGSLISYLGNDNETRNKYLAHMAYVKTCGGGVGDCWHTAGQWFTLDGEPVGAGIPSLSFIVLKSGAFVAFNRVSDICQGESAASVYEVCADIYVDVNGYKGPNTFGRDIFFLYITDKGLAPRGYKGTWWRCNPTNEEDDGWGCAAYVLQNKDY